MKSCFSKFMVTIPVLFILLFFSCTLSDDGSSIDNLESGIIDSNPLGLFRSSASQQVGSLIAKYTWTEGWTTVKTFRVSGATYLFLLKKSGTGSDGKNVHIHEMNSDGSVGSKIGAYGWSTGWTTVEFLYTSDGVYLFLLKETGTVHINEINSDGTVGDLIASYSWTEGWDTAEFYGDSNGNNNLFIMKSSGYGNSGHNVHLHRINDDGTLNTTAFAKYKWSEGWTDAFFNYYPTGTKMLMIYKKSGYGNDGYNAHEHYINDNGTIGSMSDRKNFSSGVTFCPVLYTYSTQGGGGSYYNLLGVKESGTFSDGNRLNLYRYFMGDLIDSKSWRTGWSNLDSYCTNTTNTSYFIQSRASGYSSDGYNFKIYKMND